MHRFRLALAIMFGAFFFPASAFAIDCDSIVSDGANIFGRDIDKVEHAAAALAKAGATVRVHTIDALPSNTATLIDYKNRALQECPTWRSADSDSGHIGMRNNLILFMIAVESRDMGIIYGDQWSQAFRNNQEAYIQANIMGPRFRDGDFAGGFADGITYAENLVRAQLSPPASSNTPTTIIRQEASDNSGFLTLFWVIIVMSGLGTAVMLAMRYVARQREIRETVSKALHSAQLAKNECANAITRFDTVILEAKLAAIKTLVNDSDYAALAQELEHKKREHAALSASFAELEETAGSNLNDSSQSASIYESIGAKYADLAKQFMQGAASLGALDATLERAKSDAQKAPARIAEAREAIEVSKASVETVRGKGFRVTEADELLAKATSALVQADTLLKEKRGAAATQSAMQAVESARSATNASNAQVQLKERLDRDIAQTRTITKSSDDRIESAYQLFTSMSQRYAEELWAHVQGNGTESEKRIDTALELLDEAETLASMDKQDWTAAKQSLQRASVAVQEADELINAIIELNKQIEVAEKNAQLEVQAAQADIARAWQFIKAHDADVADALEDTLRAVEQSLALASDELTKEKPNFIRAYKAALKANGDADRILATAENEHETAERKRRQAENQRAEAKRSIDAAERYINIHKADVGERAIARLRSAYAAMEEVRSTRTIDQLLQYTKLADQEADEALRLAQADVAAEEERIRAAERARQRAHEEALEMNRRAARDRATSFPSSTSYTPSRSSWGTRSSTGSSSSRPSSSGSGSSISFGGSSRGSGSSSSFGRSSSGRGSTSKW